MKFKNLILTLILAISLTSCNLDPLVPEQGQVKNVEKLNKYDDVIYDYFDTVTVFSAYAENDKEYQKYRDVLEEGLKRYHQFFNTYYDFEGVNNVKTINENAGDKPVEVDPEVIELIEYGIDMYDKTDGKINIALGNLLGLWHDYRQEAIANPKNAKIPTEEELKEAASHSDINSIEIDKKNNTVFISDPETSIDVGAIGKGYAIKKIEEDLRQAGMEHGILSIGGDDVMFGTNPAKTHSLWKIAIQNPDLNSSHPYSSIIGVEDTTVVTSGDYQRFYKVGDEIFHHIIDPETMKPAKYFRSVSVVHPDIALSDTLSTYFFTVDLEKGMELAKKYEAEVLWIDAKGNQYKTPGWDKIEDKE